MISRNIFQIIIGDIHKPCRQLRGEGLSQMTTFTTSTLFSKSANKWESVKNDPIAIGFCGIFIPNLAYYGCFLTISSFESNFGNCGPLYHLWMPRKKTETKPNCKIIGVMLLHFSEICDSVLDAEKSTKILNLSCACNFLSSTQNLYEIMNVDAGEEVLFV